MSWGFCPLLYGGGGISLRQFSSAFYWALNRVLSSYLKI
jgi:hypothetical protein